MPLAFIMLSLDRGFEQEVMAKLREISDVREAWFLYGLYDVIVKAETKSLDELKQTITDRIRRLSGVRSTLTMLVMAHK